MCQKIIKEYVENSEEKIKTLEHEYRKDNWSKSITGIKLQNNKNLFIERNKFYKQHCETFNQNIKDDINKFNNLCDIPNEKLPRRPNFNMQFIK